MNIAFPAIFIFFLILPGFIFQSRFRQSEKTNLDHKPFAETTALSVLVAMCLHLIWASLAKLCGYTIDFQTSFSLLMSHSGTSLEAASSSAMRHPLAIFSYHFSLLLFSWVSGDRLNKWVTTHHWDKTEPLKSIFRFDTPWYNLFTIDDQAFDGVYVSAIVPINKEITFLYTGILSDYYLNDVGDKNHPCKRIPQKNGIRQIQS